MKNFPTVNFEELRYCGVEMLFPGSPQSLYVEISYKSNHVSVRQGRIWVATRRHSQKHGPVPATNVAGLSPDPPHSPERSDRGEDGSTRRRKIVAKECSLAVHLLPTHGHLARVDTVPRNIPARPGQTHGKPGLNGIATSSP